MSEKPPQTPESRERISVSNLARRIISQETGEVFYILTIRKRKETSGIKVYTPIGGGEKLMSHGKELLKNLLGAEFKEGTEEGDDARYTLDVSHMSPEEKKAFLLRIARFHATPHPWYAEESVQREFMEEVAGSLVEGILHSGERSLEDTVISEEEKEAYTESPVFVRVIPPDDEASTSARGPAHRVFKYYDVTLPQSLIEKMKKTDHLLFLSEEEVRLAGEAKARGENMVSLPQGVNIITEHLEVS